MKSCHLAEVSRGDAIRNGQYLWKLCGAFSNEDASPRPCTCALTKAAENYLRNGPQWANNSSAVRSLSSTLPPLLLTAVAALHCWQGCWARHRRFPQTRRDSAAPLPPVGTLQVEGGGGLQPPPQVIRFLLTTSRQARKKDLTPFCRQRWEACCHRRLAPRISDLGVLTGRHTGSRLAGYINSAPCSAAIPLSGCPARQAASL